MAFFRVNPVDTTGVVIAAAGTATERARFIAIGYSNAGTGTIVFRLYDGTAAAGTMRAEIALSAGGNVYLLNDNAGRSVFPKTWFTAGSAIECSLSAAGDVRVFGEVIREV